MLVEFKLLVGTTSGFSAFHAAEVIIKPFLGNKLFPPKSDISSILEEPAGFPNLAKVLQKATQQDKDACARLSTLADQDKDRVRANIVSLNMQANTEGLLKELKQGENALEILRLAGESLWVPVLVKSQGIEIVSLT